MATDVKNDSSLSTSLIHYWELEETSGTRVDSHGTLDLTDNNTVLSATGIQGTAADFESANSEYLNNSSSGCNYSSGNDISFAFWMKLETTGIFQWPIYEGNGANTGFGMRIDTTNQAFLNFYQTGGLESKWRSTDALFTSTGTWYHVVVTIDVSARGYALYVDEASKGGAGLGAQTATAATPGAQFHLGAAPGPAQIFDGVIDEVGVWNKILSGSEVTALYNSGAGIPYDAGGGGPTFIPKVMMF